MPAMKFIGGRAVLGRWGLGDKTKDVEEAIDNTMASYQFFADLEIEHESASLKLRLAFSDDDNLEQEPMFRVSLDDLLEEALGTAESEEQFLAFLEKLQASIDRARGQK
jgi:hypothetical protein